MDKVFIDAAAKEVLIMKNNSFGTATLLNPVLSGSALEYKGRSILRGKTDPVDFFSLAVQPARSRSTAQVKLNDIGVKEKKFSLKAELFFSSPAVTQNQIVPVRSFKITKKNFTTSFDFDPVSSPGTLYVKFSTPMKDLKYSFFVSSIFL
jgi:hypothetical protein